MCVTVYTLLGQLYLNKQYAKVKDKIIVAKNTTCQKHIKFNIFAYLNLDGDSFWPCSVCVCIYTDYI